MEGVPAVTQGAPVGGRRIGLAAGDLIVDGYRQEDAVENDEQVKSGGGEGESTGNVPRGTNEEGDGQT